MAVDHDSVSCEWPSASCRRFAGEKSALYQLGAICLAVTGLIFSEPSAAQNLPKCDYSAAQTSENAVVIDANSGNVLSTKTMFPDGGLVQLTFVHKNPYVYSYAYDIKGVALDAATIRQFLEKIGALQVSEPDPADDSAAAQRNPLGNCTKISQTQMQKVLEIGIARVGLSKILAGSVSTLNQKTRAFDQRVEAINRTLPTNIQSCQDLRGQGVSLLATISDIDTVGASLKQSRGQLKSIRDELDAAVRPQMRGQMQNDSSCTTALSIITNTAAALDSDIRVADEAQSKLTAKSPKINAARELITEAHTNVSAFVEIRPIGPVDEATDYGISITRTRISDSDEVATKAASRNVRLGTPVFSYSIGASVGFADQVTYGRAASVSGTGDVVSVVDETDSSNTQFGLVGQLNARLGRVGQTGTWGWALGATLSDDTDGTELNLYTGPFISVAKRVFITAAYYASDETRLAGGFEVGEEVPSDLQGEIPTTEETTGAVLITITYDFQ